MSGENVKTINGKSILGNGDIDLPISKMQEEINVLKSTVAALQATIKELTITK